MDHKEFVRSVAERSRLSREESADITRAVLEGLAGQLSEGEARRLAMDLPGPLVEQLGKPRQRKKEAHPAGVEDFIKQVSQRTGLTNEEARTGTGAVLATLREAMSKEDYGHLVGQLPTAYTTLAEAAG
jgi:uncharacterized protein (DUF2267 family)